MFVTWARGDHVEGTSLPVMPRPRRVKRRESTPGGVLPRQRQAGRALRYSTGSWAFTQARIPPLRFSAFAYPAPRSIDTIFPLRLPERQ